MEWIVLGSGTILSRGPRTAAAYAARVGEEHLLFDAGPGTLLRMGEAGIRLEDLEHVFITHLHVDHVSDVPALLFARAIPGVENSPSLTLWGPEGFEEMVDMLRGVWGEWLAGRDYDQRIRRFPGEHAGHGWHVASRGVRHTEGALGYRIEADGRTAAYTGDTGYCEGVVELCRDADLAVLECSLPDELAVDVHLTPSGCARVAREAGARRVLLTHFYPQCDPEEAARIVTAGFDGEVLVAEDGLRLEV